MKVSLNHFSLLVVSGGDPIFPYLFLFCVEGFSALLKEAQENNLLRGVQFGAEGPHITHLLFADDSVVFLEATNGSLQKLRGFFMIMRRAQVSKLTCRSQLFSLALGVRIYSIMT
jgi:hypothetical protein